jgi:hypothetical protein
MPSFATVGFEAPKTVILPHTGDSLAIDSVNQAIAELSAEKIGMAVNPASISNLPPEIRDMISELVPPMPRLITVTWSKDAVIVPQRQSNSTYWVAVQMFLLSCMLTTFQGPAARSTAEKTTP